MTDEEKRAYQENMRCAQQQWQGGTFQHFDSDEQREDHLGEVRRRQESNEVPF